MEKRGKIVRIFSHRLFYPIGDGYDETNDRNFLNEILEEKNREEYIFFFF